MLKTKDELKRKFDKYVADYDMNDRLINYKYYHTFRVADNAEKIAKSLNMSDEEVEIAYLVGLLHDVGRFYQVKKYQTYSDVSSNLDHGDLGYEVLTDGLIRDFIDDSKYDYIIFESVRNHNKLKIDDSKEYDELTLKYIKLVRDADKLDILYVLSSKMDQTIDYDKYIDENVSLDVINDLKNKKVVNYSKIKSSADMYVVYFGYIYDICYKYTISCILENRYFDKYISLLSLSDNTKKEFEELCTDVDQYLLERINKD